MSTAVTVPRVHYWSAMGVAPMLGLTSALFFLGSPVRADGSLGPNGTSIQTSRYAVDLAEGVALGNGRVIGLGGAYVAIAEDVEGATHNPAAPAVRPAHSFEKTAVDIGVDLSFPGSVARRDYFNTGRPTTDLGPISSEFLGFVFLSVSGILQYGPWGTGLVLDYKNYGLGRAGQTGVNAPRDQLHAGFLTTHLQLARRFGDLVVGAGPRITQLTVSRNQVPLVSASGAALEAGFVYMPTEYNVRLGAAFRSPVRTRAGTRQSGVVQLPNGDQIIPDDPADIGNPSPQNALYLPDSVVLPWEVEMGTAMQFGPRPLNPKWVTAAAVLEPLRRYLDWRKQERKRVRAYRLLKAERAGHDLTAAANAIDAEQALESTLDSAQFREERERINDELALRYARRSRRYLLLAASMSMTGSIADAVGVESFLQRRVNRSGQTPSVTPRIGVETEPLPNWIRLRVGSYLEPTRFHTPEAAPRLHGTASLDLRMFTWDVFRLFSKRTTWRAAGSIDIAARYVVWGFAIGMWH